MKRFLLALGMLSALATIGCQASDEPTPEQTGTDNDVLVALEDIPQNIKDAAIAAAPGLVIEEAELENDGTVYCVHGQVDGTFTEVEVNLAGEVLEIDSGEEDDEDDDDGDGDGDEEGDDDDEEESPSSED